jgi:hypothetical protein
MTAMNADYMAFCQMAPAFMSEIGYVIVTPHDSMVDCEHIFRLIVQWLKCNRNGNTEDAAVKIPCDAPAGPAGWPHCQSRNIHVIAGFRSREHDPP